MKVSCPINTVAVDQTPTRLASPDPTSPRTEHKVVVQRATYVVPFDSNRGPLGAILGQVAVIAEPELEEATADVPVVWATAASKPMNWPKRPLQQRPRHLPNCVAMNGQRGAGAENFDCGQFPVALA